MPTSPEIRQQFIDFFVNDCGHTFVPSSPVIPHDDPTLLFANAGMNQFKDVFLNLGTRPYRRAVNTQKCIRAGGKHNDLDDVGKDTYHHTFFEMLGNWSFGDYFKREAIEWAWRLLTGVWGMDKARLHATVFEGAPQHGVERDDEATDLWRTVTDIPHANIHLGSMKDNFWEMGDTGPCGPCSEIHIDLTPDKSGGKLVNAGTAKVIEIWNLVFIQYNRDSSGKLTQLPAQHVDTGMGFERLCAVLQKKTSNYDTDVFAQIFSAIAAITGAAPYSGALDRPEDIAYRVLADHARALVFALTDGAVPGNEGRGYVLRRILRRAVRYGRQKLGVREPFFHRLVPSVVEPLAPFFPELGKDPGAVAEIIREEETLFSRTLDRGIEHFNHAAASGGSKIEGKAAFELFATYGFPLDLTQLMAEERGLSVDVDGFNEQMSRHQEVSRGQGGSADSRQLLVEVVQASNLPATEFIGYESCQTDAGEIMAMLERLPDGRFSAAKSLAAGAPGALVFAKTPFYAEAGGQVGDTGTISSSGGGRFTVDDTIKVGDIVFHLGRVEEGKLSATETKPWKLAVDADRRAATMIHHTSTHLLNHALRAALGDHVQQRGSLVDDSKTRFDFSHGQPLSDEQLQQIEKHVNERIEQDLPVYASEADQGEALQIHGLRAVFGEKYPPKVRVVSIGVPVRTLLADKSNRGWYDYSVEFCGGTHIDNTSRIGRFILVGDEAVAKGVRRVVGVAGARADEAAREGEEILGAVASLLENTPPTELGRAAAEWSERIGAATIPLAVRSKARSIIVDLQRLAKDVDKQKSKAGAGKATDAARQMAQSEPGAVIVAVIDDADASALRSATDVISGLRPDVAMLLGSVSDGKVCFIARVPPPLVAKGLKAGDWVREAAKITGGGGGGRPDMAQAGGKDPSKLAAALEAGRAFAMSRIST